MTIENFDAKKLEKEIDDAGGVDEWIMMKAEQNDTFRGIELNEANVARLNKLNELAKRLSDLEPDISYKWKPLTNKERHGTVMLETDLMGFLTIDRRVLDVLSDMYHIADMVNMNVAVEGKDKILTTFSVMEMWDKFEYRE